MKKQTAKERIAARKKQEEERKQNFRQAEIKRQEETEKKKLEEEEERKKAAYKKELAGIEKDNPEYAKSKKSRAKAAGVKSVFVLNDSKLLVTAFGKGNEACPDKYVDNGSISDAIEKPVLTMENANPGFKVSGRMVHDAPVDNPLSFNKPIGLDQIKCKGNLEKIYFGREFNDNLHIQLIYNILDIEKILTVHVNNIVFELNNMLRMDDEEHFDLIGYLGDRQTYEKFKTYKNGEVYDLFVKLINQKQMGYFGDIFVMPRGKNKRPTDAEKEEFEKKCYYLLVTLGIVRQATAHGDSNTRSNIYNIGEAKKILKQAGIELDNMYAKKIEALNKSFIETSGKDLHILSKVYSLTTPEEKNELAKDYYSFAVLKSYKNMGFSIKRVRENLQTVWPNMKDKEFDTVRHKLNKMLDFIIWKHYLDNFDKLQELVESLRATTKESEKEFIYRKEAAELWKSIENTVRHNMIPFMNGNVIAKLEKDETNENTLSQIQITSDADSFSKMVFLLTIFLDGKEINDLLTQLISNFDNIYSFIKIAKGEGISVEFSDRYSIFAKSDEISKELRVINSFSRMTKEAPAAKRVMFMEAAELLGYDKAIELENVLDTMLSSEVTGDQNKGFRNFIINNVIESDRFKYLVRYGNPKKLRNIANNKKVVNFVLKEIPDNQILFYYNSCNGVLKEYNDKMRDDLAKKIVELDFMDFQNIKKGNKLDSREAEEKERKKNIVRLYLTVLYLLVKNLVYVNSRYYLAFHCQERDSLLYNNEKYKEEKDRRQFAIDFVRENSNNTRAKRYIEQNYANSDEWASNAFRNCVEHMNAIRNMDKYVNDIQDFDSYFEIYHYLVQRSVKDQFDFDCKTKSTKNPGTMIMSEEQANPKLLQYFNVVNKYNSYCKDFVKALNVPFAYNLARYKNLSINELFDRNNYLPNTKDKMEVEETDE